MKSSFFSKAFKYCQTETSSQIENFTTEMFCFLWNYIRHDDKFNGISLEIAKFFSLDNDTITLIETQISYSDFSDEAFKPINQSSAIPDISIKLNSNEYVFIEVKIDQELNRYKNEIGEEFDQIDLYKNIKRCKTVHLLSKNFIEKKDFNCSHRWHEIYKLFSPYKERDFLIQEFLLFLDENNMGQKSALRNYSSDLLEFIGAFDSILHEAWQNSGIKDFYLSKNCYAYKSGFGYYIRENCTNDTSGETNLFLGINSYPNEKNNISFYICDSENKLNINELSPYKKVSNKDFLTKENLEIEKLFDKDVERQIQSVTNWIISNVKPYFEKCLN